MRCFQNKVYIQFSIADIPQEKYSYFNLRCRIKASSVRDIHKAAATSSTWNPNIFFIQMARHRRSSLYGRGIVNFADS